MSMNTKLCHITLLMVFIMNLATNTANANTDSSAQFLWSKEHRGLQMGLYYEPTSTMLFCRIRPSEKNRIPNNMYYSGLIHMMAQNRSYSIEVFEVNQEENISVWSYTSNKYQDKSHKIRKPIRTRELKFYEGEAIGVTPYIYINKHVNMEKGKKYVVKFKMQLWENVDENTWYIKSVNFPEIKMQIEPQASHAE